MGDRANGQQLNYRNGVRRIALLAGGIGTVFGGFASFRAYQQVTLYNRFEALSSSESVQTEAKKYTADVEEERAKYFAEERRIQTQVPPEGDVQELGDETREVKSYFQKVNEIKSNIDQTSAALDRIERTHSDLNRDGIKTISWTKGYAQDSINDSMPWPRHLEVESIVTESRETLYDLPKPKSSVYFSICFLPILGFIAAWLAVRAIAWTLAGFSREPG